MTSAKPRLSRVILAAAAAGLACAASAPAIAGGPAFLKLGGVEGESKGKHGHKDEIEILSYSWGQSQAARVNKVDAFTVKQRTAARESGEKGGTEDINIGVGELQEAKPSGGVRVAAGDVDGDGASGVVTEKRQHGWVTVSKPLERGAVRVKVKFPWAGCRVGARYPSLELGGDGQRYLLQDVTVASCSTSGDADDRPTEEIAFYYNKIAFNY